MSDKNYLLDFSADKIRSLAADVAAQESNSAKAVELIGKLSDEEIIGNYIPWEDVAYDIQTLIDQYTKSTAHNLAEHAYEDEEV